MTLKSAEPHEVLEDLKTQTYVASNMRHTYNMFACNSCTYVFFSSLVKSAIFKNVMSNTSSIAA